MTLPDPTATESCQLPGTIALGARLRLEGHYGKFHPAFEVPILASQSRDSCYSANPLAAHKRR